MTTLTKAQDVITAFAAGLEIQAYDFAMDNAVTIRSASDCDMIRFDDNSEVKVFVSEDHEITILEA